MLLLCIVAGLAYSFFLYYRSKSFDGKKRRLKILLGVLRFLSIFLIGMLLLGPLFKTTEKESKRPNIAILQDDSKSIGQWLGTDKNDYRNKIVALADALKEKFNVDVYAFGKDVIETIVDSLNLVEEQTNIGKAIEYVSDIYEGDNLGTVIIATDGLYNDGKSPIYSNFNHPAPIYGIAMGDTTSKNDLMVKRVLHNEVAYLGDQVTVQADIVATGSNGNRTRLTVQRKLDNSFVNVYTKDIAINSDNFYTSDEVTLDLNQVGIVQYRFMASPLNNESNKENNVRDIFIEVLDARQNILILAHAPHPDLGTLKQLLERNKNYEALISFDLPTSREMGEVDMVIFHNLPSKRLSIKALVAELDRKKTPRVFITGNQTDLPSFNTAQKIINIKGQNQVVNQAQAVIVDGFNSFSISDNLKGRFKQYPPLSAPFGEYTANQPMATLLNQKIGTVATNFPLISFNDQEGVKTAFIFGEGLWKWKYFDFAESGNFDVVGELIDKTILYASTVEDKRKFRVSTSESIYPEYDDIIFNAELYNSSYELVNDAEVTLTILNQSNQEFKYTFYPDDKGYLLNAGKLIPGDYRYRANTSYGGESFEAAGRFSVREIQYELFDLEANQSVLNALAQKSDGKVYSTDQIDALTAEILSNDNLKPVIYLNQTTKSILDYKWLFALLALLLGTEWFLRRYFGSL